MYKFVVSICKRTVELDVPYDIFFPSPIVDAAYSKGFIRWLRLKIGLESYTVEKVRTNIVKAMVSALPRITWWIRWWRFSAAWIYVYLVRLEKLASAVDDLDLYPSKDE